MTRHFTYDYREPVTLRDGTEVLLRLVRPDDKELLRRGFERWSNESRYARFLAPKERLTDDELRYLTELDQETHFALGAVAGDVGLGIARFIRVAGSDTAEAAIAVADEAQGQGLGRLLFLRLAAAAVERGIERFQCEVLGSNTSVKSMLEACGPVHTTEVSMGVMSIELPLAKIAPTAPSDERPPGAMYRLFRAAAEKQIEWTAAVRRLWRLD